MKLPAPFLQLLYLVAAILVVGVLVWGIDQFEAIDAQFKKAAKVILIVALVIVAIIIIFNLVAGLLV